MSLDDVQLKYKLGGILVLALACLIYFAWHDISNESATVNEMNDNLELADFSVKISDLVHELQKERGATAGFIGSKGEKFVTELPAQRKSTDEKLKAFNDYLADHSFEALQGFNDTSNAALKELKATRTEVSSLTITVPKAIGYYTGTIRKLLETIGTMPTLITDGEVGMHFIGYYLLNLYKEPMGIERAVLSGTFAADKFAPGMSRKLIELIKAQANARQIYLAVMPEDDKGALIEGTKGDIFTETNRLRELAISKANEGGFGVDATLWFKLQTQKINQVNDKVINGHLQKELIKFTNTRKENASWSLTKSWIISIIVLLICSGFSILIIRNITKAVGETATAVSKIAAGDFTQVINVSGADEIGTLGSRVNDMVDNLRQMIMNINNSSQTMASSADELTEVANQLASGANEMTSQAESVAGATEEMSANINSVASAMEEMSVNVATVSSGAEEMSANMDSVTGAVNEMTVAIDEVSRSAGEAADVSEKATEMSEVATGRMNTLGDAAKEIGKVTDVIKRIAEQTNLLALNATIEAASAGEAGKGFAVVANEIKELANQSAQAAEDIASKIEGIQGNTSEAIKVITEVSEIITTINDSVSVITGAVERQSGVTSQISSNVSEAARGVTNIAESISDISKAANDVSRNAGEASQGVDDVSMNIHGVSKAANDTNVGAQQVNNSSTELARVATELQEMVSVFKVSD